MHEPSTMWIIKILDLYSEPWTFKLILSVNCKATQIKLKKDCPTVLISPHCRSYWVDDQNFPVQHLKL